MNNYTVDLKTAPIREEEIEVGKILVDAGLRCGDGTKFAYWRRLPGLPYLPIHRLNRIRAMWKEAAAEEYWHGHPERLAAALAIYAEMNEPYRQCYGWFYKRLEVWQKTQLRG